MGSVVDVAGLPVKFPTHRHEEAFWESLGRAVATFGFLEEILAKAIFALTATRPWEQGDIQQAYDAWVVKLERALMDPLGNLIEVYGKAMRDHPDATTDDLDRLLEALRKAAEMRNILCHSSWRPPNPSGASLPFFVNRQKRVVDSAIDQRFLDQVQRHTAELSCAVINTVTRMGWRFPGADGPGRAIWDD
jgi:thymidylate synthase